MTPLVGGSETSDSCPKLALPSGPQEKQTNSFAPEIESIKQEKCVLLLYNGLLTTRIVGRHCSCS